MSKKPRKKQLKEARIEARSTIEEADAIRALAKGLNLSITEYILYKTLDDGLCFIGVHPKKHLGRAHCNFSAAI